MADGEVRMDSTFGVVRKRVSTGAAVAKRSL